ncbi:hypothetical protein [Kineosporia corallincola]|uniref:hypothetical protein n=1 Tax=Kineosporia corallincola TaxID=2835133 RepID=UPI001FE92D2A|nr:hypothetical protein [Kineosporia corallincola]
MSVVLSTVVARVSELEAEPPQHVVLTCPAVWGPYRREQFTEMIRGRDWTWSGSRSSPRPRR